MKPPAICDVYECKDRVQFEVGWSIVWPKNRPATAVGEYVYSLHVCGTHRIRWPFDPREVKVIGVRRIR